MFPYHQSIPAKTCLRYKFPLDNSLSTDTMTEIDSVIILQLMEVNWGKTVEVVNPNMFEKRNRILMVHFDEKQTCFQSKPLDQ